MRGRTATRGLAALFLLGGALLADWADYRTVSLPEAWALAGTAPDQSVDTYIGHPEQYKFLVAGVFTGQVRAISARRAELIANWGKTMGTPDFTKRFQREIQVTAEGLTVWLPIQESLMREFGQEAKAGGVLSVWMMYIGATQQDRVFLVNDFDAMTVTLARNAVPN